MFRKPKGGKAAFKSKSASRKKAAFRKRRGGDGSSDDSDGGNGDGVGGEDGTSSLLDQIRSEKERAKGGGGKRRRRAAGGGASDEDEDGGGGGGGSSRVMHEYGSADPSGEMSAREMATRGAEYHPKENTQGASTAGNDKRGGGDGGGGGEEDEGDDTGAKIYKGQSNAPRNKFLAGPLKAPTFVRTTCRFDYQPDICKDYKDTGFCGFGDTCIYLHDRGDTASGWQLEAQYEERKKREAERKEREMQKFLDGAGGGGEAGSASDDDDAEEKTGKAGQGDGIPFACHICRGPFRDPVVTSCGHYFCQGCILDRVRGAFGEGRTGEGGDTTCPVCSKDTHGVFNAPTKLEAKKRRAVGRDGTWEELFESQSKKRKTEKGP